MRLFFILVLMVGVAFSCKTNKTQITDSEGANVETRSTDRSPRPERGERRERPSVEEIFKMDTNSDGLLSKTELGDSPLARNFDTIDSNKDGLISKTEFENAPKPQRAKRQRNK